MKIKNHTWIHSIECTLSFMSLCFHISSVYIPPGKVQVTQLVPALLKCVANSFHRKQKLERPTNLSCALRTRQDTRKSC